MTTETSNARGEWSLVPHTPTPEMIDAGILFGTSPNKATIIYQSMVNAAPPPAATRGGVVAWADLPWRAAAGWLRSASGSKIMEVGTHEWCISQRESELIAAAVNSYATAPPAAARGD